MATLGPDYGLRHPSTFWDLGHRHDELHEAAALEQPSRGHDHLRCGGAAVSWLIADADGSGTAICHLSQGHCVMLAQRLSAHRGSMLPLSSIFPRE